MRSSSTSSDAGEFPRDRLRFLDVLGEGTFGKVMLSEALNIIGTGRWETVAVKMCKGVYYFVLCVYMYVFACILYLSVCICVRACVVFLFLLLYKFWC